MNCQEAQQLMKQGKAVIVDVREAEELRETGIAEGALWMPTSEISEDTDHWRAFKAKLPKDKQILLYCRSGNRSGRVAEFLAQDGFQAENIGCLNDWMNAGLPVAKFAG